MAGRMDMDAAVAKARAKARWRPNMKSKPIAPLLASPLCAVFTLIALMALGGCGSANDAARFAGTWDLQYGKSAENNDSLSSENVQAMRTLGLEAYLNLDESGSLALVTFDEVKYGSWKVTGGTAANATVEGQSASIVLDGDELRLVQSGATLVFSKGDPKGSDPSSGLPYDHGDDAGKASTGLSEMVVRGALLDEPVTVTDDSVCTIVVDGTGVDRLGDPGYNVQITNNQDTAIDVWILDPFMVDGSAVTVYLFETVDPGKSVTSFMQFDVADMKSMGAGSLVNVTGTILVDGDDNKTIAAYPFSM